MALYHGMEMNPLSGKPLRYLIGADSVGQGRDGEVVVVPYGKSAVRHGISVGYCNLFDELNTGKYGPYLYTSDTAYDYDEGQIDPRGPGWVKNLSEQFKLRVRQGFEYIELDNPDAYAIKDVIGAIEFAGNEYGLKVLAKNPGLFESPKFRIIYVSHPNVYGVIVEKSAGIPQRMDVLRNEAGKPDLPVWFVAFKSGRTWAKNTAETAKNYPNMGVTWSKHGEYTDSIDILKPWQNR